MWGGCQFLHPYQERIKYFISVFIAVFAMAFSVYALPDEMLLENAEHIDVGIYESGITNDGWDDYNIINGPIVRSPSINPNVDFQYYGMTITPRSDGTGGYMSINFTGNLPSPYNVFRVFIGQDPARIDPPNYNSFSTLLQDGVIIRSVTMRSYDFTNNRYDDSVPTIILDDPNILYDGSSITIGEDVPTISFLASASQVFSWILSSLSTFIIFLLGNPFLAVMLCLFLVGVVVSFFVRIRG